MYNLVFLAGPAGGAGGGGRGPGVSSGMDITQPNFSIEFLMNFVRDLYNLGLYIYNFLASEPPDLTLYWFDSFTNLELVPYVIANPFPSIWSMMLGGAGITIGLLLLLRLISHMIPT